jgi:hypothetical protein
VYCFATGNLFDFFFLQKQNSVGLKKKYHMCYLWNCEIFQTELYKNFEVEVLGLLEEEEAFLSNRRVQFAMPELVSTLQADFGTITSSLISMKAANAQSM